MTVVGELAVTSQEDQKKFVIRRPQDSSGPFYITRQTLEDLHSSLSQVASTCKVGCCYAKHNSKGIASDFPDKLLTFYADYGYSGWRLVLACLGWPYSVLKL